MSPQEPVSRSEPGGPAMWPQARPGFLSPALLASAPAAPGRTRLQNGPGSTRRVAPTGREHLEPPIMSKVAALSIRHDLHVGDDTVRRDKAVAGVSNIGPTTANLSGDRTGTLRKGKVPCRIRSAVRRPDCAWRLSTDCPIRRQPGDNQLVQPRVPLRFPPDCPGPCVPVGKRAALPGVIRRCPAPSRG